jgi:hypothetical protein
MIYMCYIIVSNDKLKSDKLKNQNYMFYYDRLKILF